jgi:hypothetical protein
LAGGVIAVGMPGGTQALERVTAAVSSWSSDSGCATPLGANASGLCVRGQKRERVSGGQGSHSAEAPFVERGDVDRAVMLREGHQRCVSESKAGDGVPLGNAHGRRDRSRPPVDEIRAGGEIST